MPCRSVRACGREIIQTGWQNRVISLIDNAEGDNGWCLALVEPDGERTFMSFSGVENQWNRQWLARYQPLRLAACSIFPVINWPRPAANC